MASQSGNLVWQELLQDDQDRTSAMGGDYTRESSSSSSSSSIENGYKGQADSAGSQSLHRTANRKQKAVAACSGAIITSLLMTPFDVIKTRIQTQSSPEPLFRPSSHITPPLKASSQASSSRDKLPPPARAHAATCCQQTFFIGNSREDKLTCKFDPRTDQVKSTHQPGPVNDLPTPSSTASTSSSFPRFRQQAHQLRSPPNLPLTAANAYSPHAAFLNPTSAILVASEQHAASSAACAFPDRGAAALQLDAATRQNRLTGMWDGVVKVSRAEGVRGLWRGLSPTLVMTIPSQVTYMTCYDVFRSHFLALEHHTFGPPSVSQLASSNITSQTLFASLVSGALARSVSATLVTPLELVRTRLQASDVSHSLSSIVLSLSRQVSAQGPSVLFRGLASTLWRDVPFSAIYFMGYETMKRMLTGGRGLGEGGGGKGGLEEFGVAFLSGATSGTVAAVATHPFDLIKTRLQATAIDTNTSLKMQMDGQRTTHSSNVRTAMSTNTLQALRTILQEEGMAGLFRGLTPRVAKVAPACGLMIGSYEAVGHLFSKAEQDL